ncbi:hypothetical protein TTHERM_00351130 (macronuclear) [Tetrahymena thermophila SB210]|uniref:Uncharacterized protein n=1 Tax=Tetrahymena thermophila (strain SB210) TaxID=312017 RepID=I7LWT6_TETTS|nr:hypothetical protein TTHERM_00351130 [Tetrahymena thermophila SB210]EAS02825.1 hypothetical protein TTHERM_00351130 [Tetrahymena thermophila SB210]|eukprot:XP_001023070.1 hypothetical protein TTHERM_00351130 [Tetrahymena thermophila SB210]
MLSSQSDLFQEPSCDDSNQGIFNENSVQYLCNHNQSFFSQQSSTSSQDKCPSYLLCDETIPIRKDQATNGQQNLKIPQQLFIKNPQNKMVILSKKNMKKQVEINSNTSLTHFGCNLGTSETVESDDNKSESADESVKRSSWENLQISQQAEDDDDSNCFQLKKKFISPRSVEKLNAEKNQKKQSQLDLALSSYIPKNYQNNNKLASLNRNPRLNRLKKMNNQQDVNFQANVVRNHSLNERVNTEPVASRSNTPIREKVSGPKNQIYVQGKLFQNRSNSINGAYLKQNPQQIQQQFENEKRRIQSHNFRSNSLAIQEKIPASLLQKEIDNLFQTPSSQKLKTESSLNTRKNSHNAPFMINRQMMSPMRKRPLLQPVKIQSKIEYEREAMELIKYYDCKSSQQQSFSESPVKSKMISPVKPNKKFTDSLFKLSNQITELEKSMLSSYYKDFIRITPM